MNIYQVFMDIFIDSIYNHFKGIKVKDFVVAGIASGKLANFVMNVFYPRKAYILQNEEYITNNMLYMVIRDEPDINIEHYIRLKLVGNNILEFWKQIDRDENYAELTIDELLDTLDVDILMNRQDRLEKILFRIM